METIPQTKEAPLTALPPPLHDVHTAAYYCAVSPSWILKLSRRHALGHMIRGRLRLSFGEVNQLRHLVDQGQVGRPRKDSPPNLLPCLQALKDIQENK